MKMEVYLLVLVLCFSGLNFEAQATEQDYSSLILGPEFLESEKTGLDSVNDDTTDDEDELMKPNSASNDASDHEDELMKLNSGKDDTTDDEDELMKHDSENNDASDEQVGNIELNSVNEDTNYSPLILGPKCLESVKTELDSVNDDASDDEDELRKDETTDDEDELMKLNSGKDDTTDNEDELMKLNSVKDDTTDDEDELMKLNSEKDDTTDDEDELMKLNSEKDDTTDDEDELMKLNSEKDDITDDEDELMKLNSGKDDTTDDEDELMKLNSVNDDTNTTMPGPTPFSNNSVNPTPNPCPPVGVANRSVIPDSSFTATSQYNSRFGPRSGRLHGILSWEPRRNSNPNDYLQIDLGKVFSICALATQGNPRPRRLQEWTTQYKIATSNDNRFWSVYPRNSSPKLFPGNKDKYSVVKNVLDIPVSARFIRFIPTEYHEFKALRVEVYGHTVEDMTTPQPTNFPPNSTTHMTTPRQTNLSNNTTNPTPTPRPCVQNCLNGGSRYCPRNGRNYCICVGDFTGDRCQYRLFTTWPPFTQELFYKMKWISFTTVFITTRPSATSLTPYTSARPCNHSYCLNGGSRHCPRNGRNYCICFGGFTGDRCQYRMFTTWPPFTRSTTRHPFTDHRRLRCYQCFSTSISQCFSRIQYCRKDSQCVFGKVTRRGTNQTTYYVSGCSPQREGCQRLCDQAITNGSFKSCSIRCCHSDLCYTGLPTTSRPFTRLPTTSRPFTTRRPTSRHQSHRIILRLLWNLLRAIRNIIDALSILLKAHMKRGRAILYKREIVSMMTRVNFHAQRLEESRDPEVLRTKHDVSQTRMRAQAVIKKLDELIGEDSSAEKNK